MYVRKTVDRYDIVANYGLGWEAIDFVYDYQEAVRLAKEYRMMKQDVRIIKRREKKKE